MLFESVIDRQQQQQIFQRFGVFSSAGNRHNNRTKNHRRFAASDILFPEFSFSTFVLSSSKHRPSDYQLKLRLSYPPFSAVLLRFLFFHSLICMMLRFDERVPSFDMIVNVLLLFQLSIRFFFICLKNLYQSSFDHLLSGGMIRMMRVGRGLSNIVRSLFVVFNVMIIRCPDVRMICESFEHKMSLDARQNRKQRINFLIFISTTNTTMTASATTACLSFSHPNPHVHNSNNNKNNNMKIHSMNPITTCLIKKLSSLKKLDTSLMPLAVEALSSGFP
jgi:hypothetical protein